MKKRSILSLLLLCGLCVSMPLRAEDFSLSVPVKLSMLLDEVNEALVSCVVMSQDEDVIGRGKVQLPIEGGTYEGTAEVLFDASPGMNPYDAVKYQCTLRLRNKTSYQYLMPQLREEASSDLPVWAQAKDGTELIAVVEGELPGGAAGEKK